MSRETKLSDVAAQQTLSKTTAPTADSDDDADAAPTTQASLLDRARQHAATVAADHFPDLPVKRIAWEISNRRQRSTEATKHDPESDKLTMPLAWDTFEQQGWEQFSSTVRHELIHARQYHEYGEADHEETFDRWTDALDTSRHCERFTTLNWWVVCTECSGRLPRYRHSKVVKQPEKYSCGDCGGALRVEEAAGE
ncbi:sprT domain-containing protein [halophilic archaeon]|nr:sprT domain-containing protein [halophilic archaeon]